MNLTELQSSISQLPRSERETLLRFLGQQLADEAQGVRASENPQAMTLERSRWIEDLRQLREGVATGVHGTPLAEILDDLRADWTKAVVAMLNRGPIVSTGKQAIERFKLIQNLEERFDAAMKEINKSDEEPGIGNRG